MPPGTRRGGQAMRALVTEDDEILATQLAVPGSSRVSPPGTGGHWKLEDLA